MVQNLHPGFQRLEKALLLGFQHGGDALFIRLEPWIRIAHQLRKVSHQLVEKRRLFPQQITVANRAADDAALHIAAPFVGRIDAVADQERSGADMVGNHAQ